MNQARDSVLDKMDDYSKRAMAAKDTGLVCAIKVARENYLLGSDSWQDVLESVEAMLDIEEST